MHWWLQLPPGRRTQQILKEIANGPIGICWVNDRLLPAMQLADSGICNRDIGQFQCGQTQLEDLKPIVADICPLHEHVLASSGLEPE